MNKRPQHGAADGAQMRVPLGRTRETSDRDGPRDECGVFGVYAPEHDVARLAYFALYALQHRGQESAGIATAERGHITTQRDLGLVSQVFDERSLQALTGEMRDRPRALLDHRRAAAGRTRSRSTATTAAPVALAHNGNLINAVELYNELTARGRPVPLDLRLGDHRRADRRATRPSGSRTRSPTSCSAWRAPTRP